MVNDWSPEQSATYNMCPRRWWYGHIARPQPARHRTLDSVRISAIREAFAATCRTGGPTATCLPSTVPFLDYWDKHAHDAYDYERDEALRCLIETLVQLRETWPSHIAANEPFEHPNGLTGVVDMAFPSDPHTIHIRRWSWSHLATPREILEDSHLNLCAAQVMQVNPGIKITLGLYRVRHQQETIIAADPGITAQVLETLTAERAAARLRLERGDVPPVPGPYCESCTYAPYCPAMRGKITTRIATTFAQQDATHDHLEWQLQKTGPTWRPEQLLSALPDIADPTGPLVDAEELD